MASEVSILSSEDLRSLYEWLDLIPLSRPKVNISKDFADGVMMAEVVARFFPTLISLNTFRLRAGNKLNNWKLLRNTVLRRLGIDLSDYTILQLVEAKPGVIQQVLWEIRPKLVSPSQQLLSKFEVTTHKVLKMGFSFREMSGLSEIAKDRNVWKALLAEFIGVLILVFVGCGSCLEFNGTGPPSIVQISLAFGITVATMAQAIGHISGCHINPAVTVGQLVASKIKPIKAALYIIFQCLGGVAGAAILKALSPTTIPENSLGMTVPAQGLGVAQAFGIEFLITLVLVLTVFGACDENRNDVKGSVPLAIGLSITACHLAAIKYTGSSMNPARTFGPAVITGVWTEHWVYWMGPCAGGAVAGLLYQNALKAPKARSEYIYDPVAKGDPKEEEAAL